MSRYPNTPEEVAVLMEDVQSITRDELEAAMMASAVNTKHHCWTDTFACGHLMTCRCMTPKIKRRVSIECYDCQKKHGTKFDLNEAQYTLAEDPQIKEIAGKRYHGTLEGWQLMESEQPKFSSEQAKEVGDKIGADWGQIPLDEFTKGINVEMEHGSKDEQTNVINDDPIKAGKIALAHLKELDDYYTRLAKMES